MNLSDNVRSSLYMMMSMLGFTLNDLLIKSLDGALPTTQVIGIRGCFLSLFILFIAWRQGLLHRWPEVLNNRLGVRAICEAAATVFFLTALIQMPFANLVALLQALPLAVTVGAVLFLGEQVGWRRWLAIVIGLVGVLIIVRPGMEGFHFASVLVLMSVVMAAARDLITRQLPPHLPSILVSGSSAVFLACVGLVITSARGTWIPVTAGNMGILISASFFLFFGYQFVIMSMRTGELAYVVPYRYTGLLWAILLGYLIFNEVPDILTLVGASIVVLTGLYTAYREARVSRHPRKDSIDSEPV